MPITPLYIDIHTHQSKKEEDIFKMYNVIISKDDMIDSACSVGIHPWYIQSDPAPQFELLEQYISNSNVLAIGECGLDKICDTDWEIQKEIFAKQILLAKKIQKPIIVHCVRAYQECLQLIKKHYPEGKAIFHGFNKHITLAQQLTQNGYYISLGKNTLLGKMNTLIRTIPLDKVFFETDDKSIKIVDIYTYFCAVRKIPLDALKLQVADNFEQVFKHII